MSGPQEPRADDDTGWEDDHRRLWDLSKAPHNSFLRFKINSSGVNVTRQLASARNRGLAACLGCTWIAGTLDLDRAAALAR